MKVMVLLSQGYEEVEALTVVDYLRRAEIEVDMVATKGSLETVGDHGIKIVADKLIEDVDFSEYTMIVTPGGLPGAIALCEDERVTDAISKQHESGKWCASICASPMVLNAAGVSENIKGTVYPGLEEKVNFKEYVDSVVVVDEDKKVITSQGPATAVYFALEIIEQLKGKEARDEVADGLLLSKAEAYSK